MLTRTPRWSSTAVGLRGVGHSMQCARLQHARSHLWRGALALLHHHLPHVLPVAGGRALRGWGARIDVKLQCRMQKALCTRTASTLSFVQNAPPDRTSMSLP